MDLVLDTPIVYVMFESDYRIYGGGFSLAFSLAGNRPNISSHQTPTTIQKMQATATSTTQAARITTPPLLSQSNRSTESLFPV